MAPRSWWIVCLLFVGVGVGVSASGQELDAIPSVPDVALNHIANLLLADSNPDQDGLSQAYRQLSASHNGSLSRVSYEDIRQVAQSLLNDSLADVAAPADDAEVDDARYLVPPRVNQTRFFEELCE